MEHVMESGIRFYMEHEMESGIRFCMGGMVLNWGPEI